MSAFSSFIISFCVGCILLGALYMLCPTGNMSATVKYIFCLCFVCCVIGSVITLKLPDLSFFEGEKTTLAITEQNASVVAQSIFCEALTSENINFRKITVEANKLSDGSITISKVTVYTDETYEKINSIIGSTSYKVDVINE